MNELQCMRLFARSLDFIHKGSNIVRNCSISDSQYLSCCESVLLSQFTRTMQAEGPLKRSDSKMSNSLSVAKISPENGYQLHLFTRPLVGYSATS